MNTHTHTYTRTRTRISTGTLTQQQQRTDIYTWEELKSRENTFYRENSFYVERTYSRYEHLGGIGGINANADFIILAIMLFHRHLPPLAAV